MQLLRRHLLPLLLGALVGADGPALADGGFPALPHQVDPAWPALPPGWNFGEVAGVAADSKGHVFVFHRGPHPIIEFTAAGRMVRSWGDGMFLRPHAIRVDPEGNIWTVDNDTHQVLKMDPSGRVEMVFGRRGQAGESEESFNRPTDVAFAPNGDFYVSDGYGNSRVVRFSKQGRFLNAWGSKGRGEGEFDLPHSVAVGPDGRVYVGDRENYRVQVFTPDGRFLAQWRNIGSPWGLEIVPGEGMFVADGHNDRILQVTLEGEVLGAFGASGRMRGEFSFVHHLAVDPSGHVYASEIKNQRVQKFSPR